MRYNFKTLISIIIMISFLLPCPAMAKITPKEVKDKKVVVITIKKGDTLWWLSEIYYKNPEMWKRFMELNTFTNPDMIFPGEKLIVSIEDAQEIKKMLKGKVTEIKKEIKEKEKEVKEVLEKKSEEPKEVKEVEVKEVVTVKELGVPVPDEAMVKKPAKLEQDLKSLEEKSKKTTTEKELATLKEEQKMLQESIRELEEKLSGEKAEVAKLKKEKQESEDTVHFLAVGISCGLVLLLNVFK